MTHSTTQRSTLQHFGIFLLAFLFLLPGKSNALEPASPLPVPIHEVRVYENPSQPIPVANNAPTVWIARSLSPVENDLTDKLSPVLGTTLNRETATRIAAMIQTIVESAFKCKARVALHGQDGVVDCLITRLDSTSIYRGDFTLVDRDGVLHGEPTGVDMPLSPTSTIPKPRDRAYLTPLPPASEESIAEIQSALKDLSHHVAELRRDEAQLPARIPAHAGSGQVGSNPLDAMQVDSLHPVPVQTVETDAAYSQQRAATDQQIEALMEKVRQLSKEAAANDAAVRQALAAEQAQSPQAIQAAANAKQQALATAQAQAQAAQAAQIQARNAANGQPATPAESQNPAAAYQTSSISGALGTASDSAAQPPLPAGQPGSLTTVATVPGTVPIPGAPGTPGATGAPGINGANGAAGVNGVAGANGVNGAPGAAGAPGQTMYSTTSQAPIILMNSPTPPATPVPSEAEVAHLQGTLKQLTNQVEELHKQNNDLSGQIGQIEKVPAAPVVFLPTPPPVAPAPPTEAPWVPSGTTPNDPDGVTVIVP